MKRNELQYTSATRTNANLSQSGNGKSIVCLFYWYLCSLEGFFYWSLLTGCLRIVTHCHNTIAKHWISLSLCYRTNLKCCAGDSLNKCFIRIFVKKRTSVNFNFEKRCCGVDQMFSKDVTNVPTRSQSILSQLEKICQELTVENVHVVNHGVRNACFIKWDRTSVNVEAFRC